MSFNTIKLFGMVLMAAILFAYYGTFYPTTPSAALEHTGMYDYVHENQVLKRDVSHESMDVDDDSYYDESDEPEILEERIIRREISTPTPAGPSISSSRPQPVTPSVSPKAQNASASSKAKGKRVTTPTPSTATATTPDPNGFDPDVRHSNAFLDAVFANADAANVTQTLGLCRKNADFKMADYKAPLFPADSAADVLQCINDLLEIQRKHQLCVHLDPEMNAYLKWLVLTGEPKEKHRPAKSGVVDDFLFPSTPCSADSPNHQPECLVAPDAHF